MKRVKVKAYVTIRKTVDICFSFNEGEDKERAAIEAIKQKLCLYSGLDNFTINITGMEEVKED